LIELHIQHVQKSTNSAAAIQPQFGFQAIFSCRRSPDSSRKHTSERYRRRNPDQKRFFVGVNLARVAAGMCFTAYPAQSPVSSVLQLEFR
jgi:hypothetical protein